MSRCKNCNLTFDETSAWQEFCSIDCAKSYYGVSKKPEVKHDPPNSRELKSLEKHKKALAEFNKKLKHDPKFARTIKLDGVKVKDPTFGKFVEVEEEDFEDSLHPDVILGKRPVKTYKVIRNVGSDIVVRPKAKEDYEAIERQRRHSGFGDGSNTHTTLPSQNNNTSLGWFPHD